MAYTIHKHSIYNQETKDRFMSDYKESTQKFLKRIFRASGRHEEEYKKDLYAFSSEEVRCFIPVFMPKSIQSAKLYIKWIEIYTNWAILNNLTNKENQLVKMSKDWGKQFVDKNVKVFWTDWELLDITNKLVNYQDKIVPLLIFEGVLGKSNSELINLTKNDVVGSELYLTEMDGSKRAINVSKKCVRCIEMAYNQKIYEKKNGNPSDNIKAKFTTNLADNNYIIKTSLTRKERDGAADTHLIHRRMTKIAKDLGEKNFTPKGIRNSGMLYMAKELYLETGNLGVKELKQIFEKFGGFAQQVEYKMRREFLNLDTIKKLYKI